MGLSAQLAVAAPPPESSDQKQAAVEPAKTVEDKPAVEVDPAAAKALLQLKKEIRKHLAEQGKVNPLPSKVSLDAPHDFWKCAHFYRDNEMNPTRVYAAMSRDLAIADRLLTSEKPEVRRSAVVEPG